MNTLRPIHDFFRHLLSATANVALYDTAHPQVEWLSSRAYASILTVLTVTPELTIMVLDNELVVNSEPLEPSLFQARLTRIFAAKGIGMIKVLEGLTRQELDAFIAALSRPVRQEEWEISSTEHLRVGRVEVSLAPDRQDVAVDGKRVPRRVSLSDLPAEELNRFMEIYEAIRGRQKLNITGIMEVVSGFIDAFRQEAKTLFLMAVLRDADEFTFTHSANVCILNIAQAMALGIEGELLNDIGMAAMLHDIGKLFISEDILTKEGELSAEEFEIMKQHPVQGARYLLDTPGIPRVVAVTAFEHHAGYNLAGYPRLPSDWGLNLSSQLTMISDLFDALRTRRSYREPVELPQITTMMQGMMGKELHPQLTGNFLRILSQLAPSPLTSGEDYPATAR